MMSNTNLRKVVLFVLLGCAGGSKSFAQRIGDGEAVDTQEWSAAAEAVLSQVEKLSQYFVEDKDIKSIQLFATRNKSGNIEFEINVEGAGKAVVTLTVTGKALTGDDHRVNEFSIAVSSSSILYGHSYVLKSDTLDATVAASLLRHFLEHSLTEAAKQIASMMRAVSVEEIRINAVRNAEKFVAHVYSCDAISGRELCAMVFELADKRKGALHDFSVKARGLLGFLFEKVIAE